MKILITGGAGFIGSHLVNKLAENNEVVVYDNLSKGKKEYVNKKAELVKADILDKESLNKAMKNIDMVYHLAANSDVKNGVENTDVDLKNNLISTYNVLELMKYNNVKKIAFSSSSVIYGQPTIVPTRENYGPFMPVSLYGASKLGAESYITAYCSMFGLQSWIFRFANVIGPRSTHGLIYDLINKLKKDDKELEILGDGNQEKSYIHVSDCINGILYCIEKSNENINIFNLGSKDIITVKKIAEILVKEMKIKPNFKFTGGKSGWRGDIPRMQLSIEKIEKLGWSPKYNSYEAVKLTVNELIEEMWLK